MHEYDFSRFQRLVLILEIVHSKLYLSIYKIIRARGLMIEIIDISSLANPISESQFEQLCTQNRDTKFEMTSQGELIIISPTDSESGRQNADLLTQIGIYPSFVTLRVLK